MSFKVEQIILSEESEAFEEIKNIVKSSKVYNVDELYDSIDCGKIHHVLIDEDTGKIVGYGISNEYYPWEVLKIDDDCLKETDDEITKEDLEDKIAYIEVVEILPEYRGQGLGRMLVETIKDSYPAYNLALLSTQEAMDFWFAMNFRNIIGWSGCCPYLFLLRFK